MEKFKNGLSIVQLEERFELTVPIGSRVIHTGEDTAFVIR